MGLREKMAQAAARKDMKRAERIAAKTLTNGAELALELAAGRSLELDKMKLAVGAFVGESAHPEDLKRQLNELLSLRKYRTMRAFAESTLRGDWANIFLKLEAAVPLENRRAAHLLTWTNWREIGLSVGLPEEDVVKALQVMMVFRNR